jgi:pimeloyl-ACP methyl ester carboxylesterase
MNGWRASTIDLGGPVHHVDCGGEGSPPMVLVHGLGMSHALWAGVAGALASRRRVHLLDFVGHGLTPRAGRRADLPSHLEVIDRFLQEVVREPAIVVGHSTGGHLAVLEGAAAPDRVAGLVLVDAAVPVPWSSLPLVLAHLSTLPLRLPGTGELITRSAILKPVPEATVAAILKSCTRHPERIPAELVAAQVEVTRTGQARAEAQRAFLETVRSLYEENDRPARFYERAAAVRAPVLIVHGDVDPLVPVAAAKELHRRFPAWTPRIMPGIGHTPMLEDPAGLVAAVEEWAGQQHAAPEPRR